jgi:hypothetical protein
MTLLCTTKEGTLIYREPSGTYTIEQKGPKGFQILAGQPKSKVEEIIRKERLTEPLKYALE